MFFNRAATVAAVFFSFTAAALAAPLKLTPAYPQPKELKSGLAVRYAYPHDVKNLGSAEKALARKSESAAPLAGLDHRDTRIGEKVMTSRRDTQVAADITGYVRFDTAGVYTIDFLTNDGLRATIGGQLVGEFDGRQSCEETFAVEVEIPQAGWYPLHALYFQRLNTACLHMRAGLNPDRPTWMPDAAFGH